MPPDPSQSLVQFATARLQQLFPTHFPMIERVAAPPCQTAFSVATTAVATEKAAAKPEVVARCAVRACPFPAVQDNFCRGHSLIRWPSEVRCPRSPEPPSQISNA